MLCYSRYRSESLRGQCKKKPGECDMCKKYFIANESKQARKYRPPVLTKFHNLCVNVGMYLSKSIFPY